MLVGFFPVRNTWYWGGEQHSTGRERKKPQQWGGLGNVSHLRSHGGPAQPPAWGCAHTQQGKAGSGLCTHSTATQHRCGHRAWVLLHKQYSVSKTLNWITVGIGLYYPSSSFLSGGMFSLKCHVKAFSSFYLLLDLCVDGSVASNSNDIQSCASALQTWEKMSLCLNKIIIFEGSSKHWACGRLLKAHLRKAVWKTTVLLGTVLKFQTFKNKLNSLISLKLSFIVCLILCAFLWRYCHNVSMSFPLIYQRLRF